MDPRHGGGRENGGGLARGGLSLLLSFSGGEKESKPHYLEVLPRFVSSFVVLRMTLVRLFISVALRGNFVATKLPQGDTWLFQHK